MSSEQSDKVSRRRYQREQAARAEAEQLLESKSRELFLANQKLSEYSTSLEKAVEERTSELRLALAQAEAASTARSRFIATMSHEIRTPLGGLLGMIDLLSMDEENSKKLELLNYAKSAGSGLSRIVNDVLDFSKMDAGVFIFEEETVDIRALIESLRVLVEANPSYPNRNIECSIANSVPKFFLGDATRIRQVISNLVSNALRYSSDGSIAIKVKSSPHPKGALLELEVQDFGVGIPEESIKDLFKDFSQVANSLTSAAQGAGLGLAICKRILDGCGGEIGVESELGKGSTFWFKLPVEIVTQENTVVAETNYRESESPELKLDGKRVLLAEDNTINQMLLTTYLKKLNLEVELAENGLIALEKFDPSKFDVVLMDIAMPEMDGLEATKRIREKWAGHDMPPILALTAHVMDAIQDEAAVVGIDIVLSKPIPFAELEEGLLKALGEKSRQIAENVAANDPADATSLAARPQEKMSEATAESLREFFSEEELNDLVAKYENDSRAIVDKISSAISEKNFETVRTEAHSLKGSSMAMGFENISNLAKGIELHKEGMEASELHNMLSEISMRLGTIEN